MFKNQIREKVTLLYGQEQAGQICESILTLVEKWQGKTPAYQPWVDQTSSYLITYGDSISQQGQAPLATLKTFADKHLKGVLSNIHILPMFPYTSDDGFSVVDYRAVDSDLGDWSDLNALAENFDLMYDCVINHISQSSDWFQGYLTGEEAYQDYFIVSDPALDHSSVTRPRAFPVLTPFQKADGETVHIWTTFSPDQIDINFKSPKVLLESIDILLMYAANGGRSIRLDAIGFIWKVLGSSCIHLPQTHEIIKLWRIILDHTAKGCLLITETNVPHQENISYFGNADEAHMVYQFPLPPLTLHAFLSQDSRVLTKWAEGLTLEAAANLQAASKTTYFNFLASHDGIGVRPTEGILKDSDRSMMCREVERKGGRVNYKNNSDGSQSPYELNINYLSALTEPADSTQQKAAKFLAAQSLLLSFIGVPAVYYHSLLGSENDIQGMQESGINRRINREKLDLSVLETELMEEGSLRNIICTELTRLLRIRSSQAAFSPQSKQQVLNLSCGLFALIRGEDEDTVTYVMNLTEQPQQASLLYSGYDLVSGRKLNSEFTLEAYQFVWLKHH
ncbi:alpha-amylase family glycosyl hydrolase [Psychromonas aquimarina]|uniref:alpha-amylase family glycosyl hydrolase n=1 Tax=Psychromonas aquimarina TaxID=444919 RepID=UPI0003F675E9|nr:alpha-amylase family glycosyl hydrolase [Psychromonas aquimarina]